MAERSGAPADARAQPLEGAPRARVLVAGASGFAGALAARLVWNHPSLELVGATSRGDAGARLDRLHPRCHVPMELTELDLSRAEGVDACLVAYPHGASAPVVAELRGLGVQVVDLSADFRLGDLPTYERWYGPHGAPELIEGAVYGLPELHRERIGDAGLVANPGCYPTASLLALAPLAAEGLIGDVVIDAKSGVSGAGRGGGEALQFASMAENARPYRVEGHRHQPEIAEQLRLLGHDPGTDGPTFVPHLLPLDQGELVSCYVRTAGGLSQEEATALYRARYEGERFVELVEEPPGVRDVRDTNLCRIAVVARSDRLVVFAAIDNLWKGAAGQAIQNLNLMVGIDEGAGLA
ncbi:MAG: N-acetyl-gamma-glutamyl-phosphate reductase [Solirubrobacterales bacterium]